MRIMNKPHLITLGCSWAFGEGSGYSEGMREWEYERIQHDEKICWQNGWRRSVVEHFDCTHKNIAEYGSSNDRQYRLAKRYFLSKEFLNLLQKKTKVIVLWGTTSLNRYDIWLNSTETYEKILLNQVDFDLIKYGTHQDIFAFALDKYSYNESMRLKELELEILHWNQFFKLFGVQNYWYDTLGSYDYKIKPNNFFDIGNKNRSLVSVVANVHRKDNNINKPLLSVNDFEYCTSNGLLNNYSYHPKPKYYQEIGKYFINKLEKVI